MVKKEIRRKIIQYLKLLEQNGIANPSAILYGSYAKGYAHEYSDIDLIVISQDFDKNPYKYDKLLCRLTIQVEPRIEPIPAGKQEIWKKTGSVILEIAKKEGIKISLPH